MSHPPERTRTAPTMQVPSLLYADDTLRLRRNSRYHYLEPVREEGAVVVIPRFIGGDFLLVRVERVPGLGPFLEFPRGRISRGENAEEAAKRELQEETGHAPVILRRLGTIAPESSLLAWELEVFVATPEAYPSCRFDPEEILEVVPVPAKELPRLFAQGTVRDGLTLAAYALLVSCSEQALPVVPRRPSRR